MAGDARESLGGGSNGGYSGVYGISRRDGLACDNPELSYLEYKFVWLSYLQIFSIRLVAKKCLEKKAEIAELMLAPKP